MQEEWEGGIENLNRVHSPVELDKWQNYNSAGQATHRLVPTSFMNAFTSDVFQPPSEPFEIVNSVLPIVCLAASETKFAY